MKAREGEGGKDQRKERDEGEGRTKRVELGKINEREPDEGRMCSHLKCKDRGQAGGGAEKTEGRR